MIDQQTNTLFGWEESWKEVHSLLCAWEKSVNGVN